MEEIRCKKVGDKWPLPQEIKSFKFQGLKLTDDYLTDIIILAKNVEYKKPKGEV